MPCRSTRTGHPPWRIGRPRGLVPIAAAGCVVLAGCAQHAAPHQPDATSTGRAHASSTRPSTGSSTSRPQVVQTRVFRYQGTPLRFDVLSLGRITRSILKLRLTITNTGDRNAALSTNVGDGDFGNFALVDGHAMKAYFPLVTKQDHEVQDGYPSSSVLPPGRSLTASIFYPSPAPGVTTVNLASPVFPPFTAIPIEATAQVAQGEPNPTKLPLKPPDIENVTSLSDDLDGDKSVDHTGGREEIRLNTDVLFALNKATLSTKAHGILTDVAKRIDRASTTTINVDGYTDSSGNDAINNPLSRRRAVAVTRALNKLITRSSVKLQPAGHGSSHPVASNDTAAGRKKNRRVTVSIGK